jgi:1,4-alpha-glucan branching enzyme
MEDAYTPITEFAPAQLYRLPADRLKRDAPWRYFGAQVRGDRTTFRIYLPEATEVALLRPGNEWGGRHEPLTRDEEGVWSLTVPENLAGTEYKYHIRNDREYLDAPYDRARLDPFSVQVAAHPQNGGGAIYNSVVIDQDTFAWTHKAPPRPSAPMGIYELHLDTFLPGSYREIAEKIVNHVGYLGFTHVQIMPPFHTPIHESWGYLVGCPYAIYGRHGGVDDFKWMVNHLHQAGIGVIVDIPLGFSIQDWDAGIAMIDGTDLYHHAGPEGWNDQWHTRIYNHTAPHVRDYLTGIAAYLHTELGVDGARIDAVGAMLFKDYDRGMKQWERSPREAMTDAQLGLIDSLGGDRHLEDRGYWLSEAVDFPAAFFLREFHQRLEHNAPQFFTIAEESRRVFPRLATPVSEGGLGFTYAQNMGEMHRVRRYLHRPTDERHVEEIESIMLAHHPERFINAMNTHDECANGRTRLITELGSHIQLIGLAAMCWFRPGAPMIFMGDEFCEEGVFDVDRFLDWGKTGPGAALHQQQMTSNIHDLNHLLQNEPALTRQESWTLDRNGSNNEEKWFSFIRWGGDARWESSDPAEHRHDLVYIRSENHEHIRKAADIHLPCPGEYRVVYNSIDERYIGQLPYNRHDPYWTVHSDGHQVHLMLAPYQNLVLKLAE